AVFLDSRSNLQPQRRRRAPEILGHAHAIVPPFLTARPGSVFYPANGRAAAVRIPAAPPIVDQAPARKPPGRPRGSFARRGLSPRRLSIVCRHTDRTTNAMESDMTHRIERAANANRPLGGERYTSTAFMEAEW